MRPRREGAAHSLNTSGSAQKGGGMTGQLSDLVLLEGRRVGIALADGSRIDDCHLVFAGDDRVWLFRDGQDAFVNATNVCDFWECG